ncbi:MAG: tetratricopeptide repeat protein [Bacteroidetes bacterium]|nr:tetratricopeptide repeat protein [Bacteroidota bacterium]
MKNYSKSAQSYEEVVTLNNEDVNYFIRPIWIYLERLNQPARASNLAQKAVNAHPDEAMSYNLLGWSKIGEGKYDEAEILLKKSLELDPNLAAAYLNYGQLYEKKKMFNEAIADYKKAFEMGNGTSISASAADKYNQLIAKLNTPDNSVLKASLLNQ